MGLKLCFYTCIKLKEGKGYGSVSIARLCSCILRGLTSGPGFSAYRHLLLGTYLFSSDASNYDFGFCGFHQFLQEN